MKLASFQITKHYALLLGCITVVGLVLRLLYFPHNIAFGFDQARDAFISWNIYQHHEIKLLGPSSSMQGVSHGPLFYYLIGLLYTTGHGSPVFVTAFFILANASLIPLTYLFVKTISKSTFAGLLAALFFACAYEQIQWAIFISNTALANCGMVLLYTGIALFWFDKKTTGLFMALTGFIVAAQSEIFLFYTILPLLAIAAIKRRFLGKLSKRVKRVLICLFLVAFSSYGLAELKFHFPLVHTILATLQTPASTVPIIVTLSAIINRLGLIGYYTLVGISPFAGLVVICFSLLLLVKIASRQEKQFFGFWLLSPLVLATVSIGFANIYHITIGLSVLIIALISLALVRFFPKPIALVFCLVLCLTQVLTIVHKNKLGTTITLVQKGMLWQNEHQVVSYIAQRTIASSGVYALTNPFNITTVWAYAFREYWPTNIAMPVWITNSAKGYPGGDVFKENFSTIPCQYFIIREPMDGVPSYIIQPIEDLEQARSLAIDKAWFGAISVEERRNLNCLGYQS